MSEVGMGNAGSGDHGVAAEAELTEQRLRHDLKQSLSTVMLLAEIADRQPLDGRFIHETLDHMRHEVEWMRQVVVDNDEDQTGLVMDLGETVAAVWGSISWGRTCRMRFLRESDVWARVDPVCFGRAVRNLVDNAVRAARRGVVEVRVGPEAHRVVVEVHDSGPGMGRIRPQQQLGLLTVRRFAAQHGGRLTFGTSPLGGALVRLELPRATAAGELDEAGAGGAARRTTA
jgi:signal transduction histidine kinase